MKNVLIFLVFLVVTIFSVSSILAMPVVPIFSDEKGQDPLKWLDVQWHELGNPKPFPQNQAIESIWEPTDITACNVSPGYDDPLKPNALVKIKNLTGISWSNLHYVADPETTLTNWDGKIGSPVGPGVPPTLAFKIDNVGNNRPLIFESINANLIFEPNETWHFIIQDYSNQFQGPPSALDSIGIAGASAGWPPSTGSIIAPVPIPPSALLLGTGLIGLLGLRWRFKKN